MIGIKHIRGQKMRDKAISMVIAVMLVIESLGRWAAGGGSCEAFSVSPVRAEAAVREQSTQWKKKPTGSAGVLEGKSVVISIFINDSNSKWTNRAKKRANRKMNIAAEYIGGQAKKYGKNVELVTDIYKNQGLAYTFTTTMKVNDSNQKQDKLYKRVVKYINQNIDLDGIRSEYGTDSVGFFLHLNKTGVSSTLVHFAEEGEGSFYECSSVFTKCGGKEEGASTYAHELLHQFGARDLYETSLPDGITKSFVTHVERKFPDDIMFSTYTMDGKQLKYRIKNEISRVTAYFLGWKKSIPEQKTYPLTKIKQKGCFSDGTSWK